MKWSSYLAIAGVAASLAAAPVVNAQDRAPEPRREHGDSAQRMRTPGRMMGAAMSAGPAERLLERRTELGLTADQVQRLERIRDARAESEKPHQETLRKLREARRDERVDARREGAPRDSAQPRRERREAPPEARAAMEALRSSREAARKEAIAVLTPAQREKARELMEDRREQRREMRERRSS